MDFSYWSPLFSSATNCNSQPKYVILFLLEVQSYSIISFKVYNEIILIQCKQIHQKRKKKLIKIINFIVVLLKMWGQQWIHSPLQQNPKRNKSQSFMNYKLIYYALPCKTEIIFGFIYIKQSKRFHKYFCSHFKIVNSINY